MGTQQHAAALRPVLTVIVVVGFVCACGCDAPTGVKSAGPATSPAAAIGSSSRPLAGHWAQDPRLRVLMAELNRENPSWPSGPPREPESPVAATRPYQFDEMAVLASDLAKAAADIPPATRTIPMSEADRSGFLAEAGTLRAQAAELHDAAIRRDVGQMQRQMDGINATCISCHSRFRDFAGQLNRLQA